MTQKPKDTIQQQRQLQAEQDQRDKTSQKDSQQASSTSASANPSQSKDYPSNPLPPQHQSKPGSEADVHPAPHYQAKAYQGSHKLQGKRALITGGDSGIGRAVATLFAREGADVAIVYLCEDDDAATTQAAIEAEGQQALCIRGDVKDPQFCRDAVTQTVQKLGGLDILVNNAAFQEHAEQLADLSPERWDETFKTNIYGYFFMTQAALEHLKPGSAIINTSSVTALDGNAQLVDYASTKGAIVAFTYSMAKQLADQQIRVNTVAPGPVWTPLNPADRPAEDIKHFGEDTVFGRPAQPEEIAPAYVFLASNILSSYITGVCLPITGHPGY